MVLATPEEHALHALIRIILIINPEFRYRYTPRTWHLAPGPSPAPVPSAEPGTRNPGSRSRTPPKTRYLGLDSPVFRIPSWLCAVCLAHCAKKRNIDFRIPCENLVSEMRHKFPAFGIWYKVTVVHTVSQTVGLRSPDHNQTGILHASCVRVLVVLHRHSRTAI